MMMNVYYHLLQQRGRLAPGALVQRLLNVNLALLNMLPIPVLDGGHITLGPHRSDPPQAR